MQQKKKKLSEKFRTALIYIYLSFRQRPLISLSDIENQAKSSEGKNSEKEINVGDREVFCDISAKECTEPAAKAVPYSCI
jgi:hypothetical protein